MTAPVETHRGTAADLHALEPPIDRRPHVWVMEPTRTALVMGSGQKPASFDRAGLAREGIELAARRSGGGAVWIDPVATVWIDVLAPRGSRLWSDDLTATFVSVGRVWQRAFAELGVALDLARMAPRDPLARWVCWAGIGWGELFLPGHLPGAAAGGGPVGKVLGLSQRRTRWGARVQAMAVLDGSAAHAADWFDDAEAPSPARLRARSGRLDARTIAPIERRRVIEVVADHLRRAATD